MRPLRASVLLAVAVLHSSATPAQVGQPRQAKIGRIIIVGNEVTRDTVIRKAMGLEPGQILQYPLLRIAERDLARLGIFKVDAESGIRPTLTVLESDSEFKDILVQVHETHTAGFQFELGVNSQGQPVFRLVFEERNFDPLRLPMRFEDITEGRAFRGAGLRLRVALLQVPLLPSHLHYLTPLNRLRGIEARNCIP